MMNLTKKQYMLHNKYISIFVIGSILTKGVKVDVMEGITPYSQWNKFRSRFSNIYREPAKVIMKDFHLIYPELMDSVSFPEFSQDYLEVSDQVSVSRSAQTFFS